MPFWRRRGRHVDRFEDMSPSEQQETIRALERQLYFHSALVRAMEDPMRTFGLILAADDVADARATLQREFSLDEIQALVILDMQWRRAPRVEREHIRQSHDELVERLRELKGEAPDGH